MQPLFFLNDRICAKIKASYGPSPQLEAFSCLTLWLSMSVIVGETPGKEIDFSAVELNRYEDRLGTVSSRMKDKIPPEIVDRRYEEIKQYC